MLANAVEVEVKIKTKWGKYTLIQSDNSRREKYHSWDRADRRTNIHTRRRRTPQREVVSNDSNTYSETDIPMGEGLRYPPQIFTDPGLAANIPHTENEQSNTEEDRVNFIGDYCEKCASQYNRCWCNTSDWSEDLVEIENNNNNDTNISDPNLEVELTSQTSFKQPPPGWSEFRRKTICKINTLPVESISNNGLKVNDCRSISPEEFNNI